MCYGPPDPRPKWSTPAYRRTVGDVLMLTVMVVFAIPPVLFFGAIIWGFLFGPRARDEPPKGENRLPAPRHYHQTGPHNYPCHDPGCRGGQ